jgi:hypothetical protein
MTTPSAPPPPPVSESASKYLPAFERVLANQQRRHVIELVTVGVLALVAMYGWQHHAEALERRLAIVAQERAAAVTDAQKQYASAVAWQKREWTARDSLKRQRAVTDSLRLHPREFVFREAAVHDTVHDVPLASAVPLPTPPVGVPLVAASEYDALGQSCARERHDCTATLAAADSNAAHLAKLAYDRQDEAKASHTLYLACERKDFRDKLVFGIGGAIGGFVIGVAKP